MKPILILLSIAVVAAAAADQSIYATKLDNGWQVWGWAKITQAPRVITVNCQKAWEAIYFHHDPQAFSFKISASSGDRIQLRATVNKQPLKECFLPALKGGSQQITVTMKQLGLTGQNFDGLWIQAQKAETFKVSEVVLKS